MERKRKRDKPSANGSLGDGMSVQSGDVSGWQREPDQLGAAKRVTNSGNSDSPTQHGATPSFCWPVAQHPSSSHQQQYVNAPSVQQPHGQAVSSQTQVQAFQVPPQGSAHSLAGFQNQDIFSQSQNVPQPGLQTGTTDSSWSHPTAAGAQCPVGRPPPFPFPTPYSGPWDPVAWWAHNPYQPPFPYLCPGYGSYYTGPPHIGAIQRGIIKPPAGLSQKHIRVWEAQSMENMQLWTTTTQLWAAVARSDAELALQRTKIVKLEAELQAVKAQREGNIFQSDQTAAPQSVSKRGRRRKAVPASVGTMTANAPSSECNTLIEAGKKERTLSYKDHILKRSVLEEKDKSILTISELVYRPSTNDCNPKCSTLTVSPLGNEISPQKHSIRQALEFQSPTNNSLTLAKEEKAFGHIDNLSSPFKPSSHVGIRKDSHFEQHVKESVAVNFSKTTNSLDHQNVIAGDMSYVASISSAGLYAESNGNILPKDAHFNGHGMEKSVPRETQKDWQYTGEDGSDEQDEGGVSMQDDNDGDDVDDDDENALNDIHSEKVSNLWHSTFR